MQKCVREREIVVDGYIACQAKEMSLIMLIYEISAEIIGNNFPHSEKIFFFKELKVKSFKYAISGYFSYFLKYSLVHHVQAKNHIQLTLSALSALSDKHKQAEGKTMRL